MAELEISENKVKQKKVMSRRHLKIKQRVCIGLNGLRWFAWNCSRHRKTACE